MYKKVFPLCIILFLGLTSCTNPASTELGITSPGATATDMEITALTESETTTPGTSATNVPAAESKFPLPDLLTRLSPPPIVTIPKSTARISGATMDVYQMPGDRIRVVCQQPCALEERLADAVYAGYKETIQSLVRLVGFDVADQYDPIDIHLTKDKSCTRSGGENGSSGTYADNPNSIVICLYLTEKDIREYDWETQYTPETAIRLGGLGVFAHEYTHSLFFGRFRASIHDFVNPIEWHGTDPSNSRYGNLCDYGYEYDAPFTYQLCKDKKLTFAQLIQSLNDMNQLYEGGYGDRHGGMVSFNQYLSVLNNVLDTDVRPIVTDVGYQYMLSDESTTPYILPDASTPCSYQALLLSDVTVPLGTMLDINTTFDKTWKIKNSGSCDWEGVQLVYLRGDAMTTTTAFLVADTPAGGTVDVTIPMTAPGEAGVYTSEWRLRDASGQDFGSIINLTLYTRSGCSLPPQFSFFTAEPETIGPGALSMLSWGQVTNVDKLEIVGLGSVDLNGNRLLVQPNQTTTYTLQATCGTNTTTTQATVTVDNNLPAFEISDITATADPADFSGDCGEYGKEIDFSGSFISSGPGVVLYHWTRSDSASSNPRILILDQAGTQTFKDYWIIGASLSGWKEMKIFAPVESDAVRASFTLTCTP